MRKVLFFILMSSVVRTASAAPVALRLDGTQIYHSLENSPCIFGDPSCSNPEDFGFTLLPPNTEEGSAVSPAYTVGGLRRAVGDLFAVVIDLRQVKDSYNVDLFTLTIDGVVEYAFSGTVPFSDHRAGVQELLLSGFDISRFSGDSEAVFRIMFSGANGPRDRFFISAVPEPASWAILSAALIGVPFIRRRLSRT